MNAGICGRHTTVQLYSEPLPLVATQRIDGAAQAAHHRDGRTLTCPQEAHRWMRSSPAAQPSQYGRLSALGTGFGTPTTLGWRITDAPIPTP